jgi:diguanylate cyclase (GGDEF)-like protein
MLVLNVARILPVLVGFATLGLAAYELRAAIAWTDRSDRVLAQSNELQRKVVDLETGLRGYAITNDTVFLRPMVSSQQELPGDLAALERLVSGHPAQQRRARAISRAVRAYQRYWLLPALELDRSDQWLAAQIWASVGRARMEDIRARFGAFEQAERALRAERNDRVGLYERIVVGIVAASLLAIVAAAILSALWLRRRVVVPLTHLRATVDSLTCGDLAARADAGGYGEVGELARAFNVMAEELAASRTRSVELTEELERQARTDALTGVANRRAFDEHLERECADAGRHGMPLSLLLLDLNDFKAMNDVHGHATGDAVLVRVAELCASQCRVADVVARIGGDEFAVLLPRTSAFGAEKFAARLQGLIAAETFKAGGDAIVVRTAIGIATASGRAKPDELLQAADVDMYRRKHPGEAAETVKIGSSAFPSESAAA